MKRIATAITVGAAFLAALAAVLAIVEGNFIVALLAAFAAIGCLARLWPRDRQPATDSQLIQRAKAQAEAGRKLAIYERDTGLLAYWYLELRCMEECYRAKRYGHSLVLVVIEPSPGQNEWTVQGEIAGWLHKTSRETDLIAYTGNGRFLALMPETDPKAASRFVSRLKKAIPSADAAISSFPETGETLTDLLSAAVQQLGRNEQPATAARERVG